MKSFKTRLNLNNKQITQCAKHAGVARHAWNWGLDECQRAYEAGEKRPTAIDLHKRLVASVKKANPWYYDVSKCSPQQALRNLDMAYKRFFNKLARHPKRKKKGRRDSFYLEGSFKVQGKRIKVPVLGWLRTHEKLTQCEIKNCVISCQAGKWFIAFKIPFEPKKNNYASTIGCDIGIKALATLSDGMVFENPKAFTKSQVKLARLQRKLARQKRGSNNRAKTKEKIARLYYQTACVRADHIHKLTSHLTKNHGKIVIEDLNVCGMLNNRKLARSIADVGMYEFRRQLEYKCKWYGVKLVVVDRFFPSSRTCSRCGSIKDKLSLSERIYCCCSCGLEIDRDLNAAINLEHAGSSPVLACGAINKTRQLLTGKHVAVKQESNTKSDLLDLGRFLRTDASS